MLINPKVRGRRREMLLATAAAGEHLQPTQAILIRAIEYMIDDRIESDHGRLKSRLRPMRGLKRLRSARVISAGHAFVQNIRRGHYELSVELDPQHRLPAAFADFALAI